MQYFISRDKSTKQFSNWAKRDRLEEPLAEDVVANTLELGCKFVMANMQNPLEKTLRQGWSCLKLVLWKSPTLKNNVNHTSLCQTGWAAHTSKKFCGIRKSQEVSCRNVDKSEKPGEALGAGDTEILGCLEPAGKTGGFWPRISLVSTFPLGPAWLPEK